MANKKSIDTYLNNIQKPLFQLSQDELREILDTHWYPRANEALNEQRKIWDYSYLAYKGIMLQTEINRKRRANGFGIYVNVPRTFATVQGIRKHFNISKLKVNLEAIPSMPDIKRKRINAFLNYDLRRGKTLEQVKDAGFNKILYGNGFLYSYLSKRVGRYGSITGDINEKTAVVKNALDKKDKVKYFGMVARSVSPYKIFPDPDGETNDYNDSMNSPCNYTCIRDVKHINTFRRDWHGIIPDKILDSVEPGGSDMNNYEAVRETIDYLFNMDSMKYPGTVSEFIGNSKVTKKYNSNEYVEERVWIGEDFLIVQAGLGLKFCLISPNPNPKKMSNLVKLDDVRIPGEYFAMGEPYLLRYQQVEENRIHNTVLDTLHFNISSMMGINTQYLEDEYDLDIYPQKVWKFKGLPGVKIDEMMQSFSPSSSGITHALKFVDEVKEIGQSTTSITDFVTGAAKSIAGSATEANKLSGASDLAIADKIKEMAGGALTEVSRIFLSMYPIAYENEEMEVIFEKQKIYFTGAELSKVSEKRLQKIYEKYNPEEVVFLDELNISEPEFFTTGEVSLDRAGKLSQWISAIDYSKGINEVAFSTGDPRRIDIIKMGIIGLENFDVIGNPDEFLMEDQPVKTDEIALNAELNAKANMASAKNAQVENKGGAPKKNKMSLPQSSDSRLRQKAQPTNRGINQSTGKNK